MKSRKQFVQTSDEMLTGILYIFIPQMYIQGGTHKRLRNELNYRMELRDVKLLLDQMIEDGGDKDETT